jgi:ABC-type transport system involved in Fe-S cluster assembly fused permease/ATPase subunit
MTPFETIIICSIYLFCLGYTVAIFIKEENIWLRTFLVIMSFVLALYAPLLIGGAIYEKLNNKNL